MAWNHKTRVVAFAVAIQPQAGVFTTPSAADIVAVSVPTNGEDLISTEDPTATGSVWNAPRIFLGKTGNAGATAPLRGPGGTSPFAAGAWPLGRILMAAGFAEVISSAAITGTVRAGSTTTGLQLEAGASAVDDWFIGMPIQHSAIGVGQVKGTSIITDYDGTSKLAAIGETLGSAPSSGTYTIPPHVSYRLGTLASSPPLLSVSVWRDKKRYDYKDVRLETLTFDLPVANEANQAFPSIEFAMKGLPAGVSDVSNPPALTPAQLSTIAPYRNGKFMLDRVPLGHQSTQFQIGTEVAGASNAWAEFGQDAYEIMSGNRTFTLDLNQMGVADFNIDARVDAQTVMPCMSVWGISPGNRFGFVVPEIMLDPMNNPGDRNGFVNLTGNAAFKGVENSAILTIFWEGAGVAPTLNALTASSSTGTVGQAQTINIIGATSGSTITGTVPAGMTLNSAARTITGTPTTASTAAISLTETLAGATGSPRTSSIPFTVSAASSNLNALAIDRTATNAGTPTTINITGATAGSTLSGTVPPGMTLNSAARTITGTPSGTSVADISLTETLAGAGNSPRTTARPFKVRPAMLTLPRLGIIGPSTIAQNNYGASATPWRAGNLSSGPDVWALGKEHIVEFLTEAKTTAPYYGGDNQAVYGATQDQYDAQITALASRMSGVANWGAHYEVGRNDIQNNAATLADLQTWTQRDVGKLRTAGAKFIILSNLWSKTTAWGGVWASGGAARAVVDAYNAWLPTYVAANADLEIVDYASVFIDPGSADKNPFSWVTRNNTAGGYTHYSAVGAKRGGEQAVLPALKAFAAPRAYPARPGVSLLADLTGTGGTKTNATGNVADGYDVTQTANTATVVASQETINGETYQVMTISAATGTGANGGQVSMSKVGGVAVAAGKKVGIRGKAIVPASAIPYGLVLGMGSAAGQGAASQSRTFAMIPQTNDDPSTVIAAPSAAWGATPKFDGSTDLELWFESSSYVLGDTGGSTVAVSLSILFGPAASAGDTLTFKIGQLQTFELA